MGMIERTGRESYENAWVSGIPIHKVYTRGCISIGGRCFSCLQAPPATLHPFLTRSTVTLSRRAKDYVYSTEVSPTLSLSLSLSSSPLQPTLHPIVSPCLYLHLFYRFPPTLSLSPLSLALYFCTHEHRIKANSHTC